MIPCSEAQIIPLSKVLETIKSLTARLIFAVFSMFEGALPAPTPKAALPVEESDFTLPGPPVAQTIATPGGFIHIDVASIDCFSIRWIQFSGAPAAIAARRTIRAASVEHC